MHPPNPITTLYTRPPPTTSPYTLLTMPPLPLPHTVFRMGFVASYINLRFLESLLAYQELQAAGACERWRRWVVGGGGATCAHALCAV
jgi:hypothetical protein